MNDRIIVSSICDLNLHDSELLDVVVKMDEVTMHRKRHSEHHYPGMR